MYQKSSDLRKYLIISIYIDFLRFYFPFFCIHWLMGYIWTSPVSPPNDNGVPLEIPLSAPVFHSHLCRDSLAVIRAVLRLFMALRGDAV